MSIFRLMSANCDDKTRLTSVATSNTAADISSCKPFENSDEENQPMSKFF